LTLDGSAFAFFFVAVFVLYWALPRRAPVQNGLLLLASYAFYLTLRATLLPVLLVSTLVDYGVGLALGRESSSDRARRGWLATSILFNVGLLGWFKYAGFLAESVNSLLLRLGLEPALPVLQLLLPVGISYYTLMKIGYVIDVYYRRIEPCRSLVSFALFCAFFPQILAGPIGRAGRLLPQYAKARQLRPDTLSSAASTFLVGFFLKAFVGDWLAQAYVEPIMSSHASYGVVGHWVGLLTYSLQLFSDFAGYTLMAIAVGRAFAIELPPNFDYPFFSRGMMEFWRRWHISLNTWLFDYIYSPLTTGSGPLRGRLASGFIVVFLISGLWHGAAWGFVLWGLLHGIGLAIQYWWDVYYKSLCRRDRIWVERRRSRGYQAVAWAITQLFFLLTLVPFKFASVGEGAAFFAGLFQSSGAVPELKVVRVGLCALVLGLFHLAGSRYGSAAVEWFRSLPDPVRGVAYGVAIVMLAIFVPAGDGSFIYANF
jgi:alginate O-acetyltransferase complex protein AlgI